jgi:hypothetical protein
VTTASKSLFESKLESYLKDLMENPVALPGALEAAAYQTWSVDAYAQGRCAVMVGYHFCNLLYYLDKFAQTGS